MKLRAPVCLALLLAIVAGPHAGALAKGNPASWIAFAESRYGHYGAEMAISSTGVIFVCHEREAASFEYELVILRSEDRGQTWSEYAVLNDPLTGDSFEKPQMKISDGPNFERLFVAYERDGSIRGVQVAYTDASLATPTWTTVTAIDLTGIAWRFTALSLDVRPHPVNPTVVAVGALNEATSGDFEWYYSASIDAGTVYSAPVLVRSFNATALAPDAYIGVGLGAGDTAYLVTMDTGDIDPGFTEIELYTATNHGQSGWAAIPISVASLDYLLRDMTVASNPNGSGIVIAAEGSSSADPDDFNLWASNDGGATWVEPVVLGENDLDEPHAIWSSGGPRIAMVVDYNDFALLQPQAGLASNWESEIWIRGERTEDPPSVAEDPSTGELAMVGCTKPDHDLEYAYWFEADWRDGHGYGVNEDPTPAQSYGVFNSSPVIADLDGDGIKEVLITSSYPTIGGDRLERFEPANEYGYSRYVTLESSSAASSPAVWDVDDDGDQEVFVGLPSGRVTAVDHDLKLLDGWPVEFPETGDTWVSIGPVTGYGRAEIVATNADKVHVLNPIGLEMPGWPWSPVAGTAVGRAAIGDVDNDGTTEVVAAFTTGVAILNHDGTVQKIFLAPHVPASGVTLVDLDGDGDLEIAGPMTDGNVLLVHHDGGSYHVNWPYDAGTGAPVSAVSVANIMDSVSPALCFTSNASVFALDPDGNLLPGYPKFVAGTAGSEPVVARVARPGTSRPQVVVGSDDGWAHVWTALAETPRDWPHLYGVAPVLTPAVADLDNDGFNELVLPIEDSMWILDTGTPRLPAGRRWNQSGHDKARSGCADCLPGVPTAVQPVEPSGTLVSFAGAFPNPASDRTSFQFSLPFQAEVELTLYDLRGRRVRTLDSGLRAAGSHSLIWDGRDAEGQSVAAGSYFGRLVVSRGPVKQVFVRQMTVVH